MAARRFLAVALVVGLPGCEWIAGIGDKTLAGDGGIMPVDAAADVDGSVADADAHEVEDGPAVDSGGVDAPAVDSQGVDANKPDAADGGTPDAQSAPPNPSVACSKKPANAIFCEDFDTAGESIGANPPTDCNFGYALPQGGASMSLDSVDFTSGPSSAQFIEPAGTTSGSNTQQAQLGITSNLGPLATSLSFGFDVRLDVTTLADGTNGQVALLQLVTDPNSAGIGEWDILVYQQQLALIVTPRGGNELPAMPLTVPTAPLKTWLRVVLTYDSADGLRAFVDGQQVAADASLAGTAPGTITELIVGAAYSYAESPALKVEMDNIMVLGE